MAEYLVMPEHLLHKIPDTISDAAGAVIEPTANAVHDVLERAGVEGGDFVVVVNAEKIQVTGNKLDDKFYYRHSGRPGNLKIETLKMRMDKYPERVIRDAVWGMLPKNRLGRKLLRKLKIYRGPDHPHESQQPKVHTW